MCPKARSGTRHLFCRKAARVRTEPKKANEMSRLGGEGRVAEHRRRSRGAELLAGSYAMFPREKPANDGILPFHNG